MVSIFATKLEMALYQFNWFFLLPLIPNAPNMDMDLNSDKLELIKKILKVKDVEFLNKIKAVFEAVENEVWNDLPSEKQEEINKGIQNENRSDIVDF